MAKKKKSTAGKSSKTRSASSKKSAGKSGRASAAKRAGASSSRGRASASARSRVGARSSSKVRSKSGSARLRPGAASRARGAGRGSARGVPSGGGPGSKGAQGASGDAGFPSKPRKKVDADTESSGDRRSSLGRGRATRGTQIGKAEREYSRDDQGVGNRDREPLRDDYYPPQGLGSESGGQSGDVEGLSMDEDAAPESVEELVEEGQDYEAEIVAGVERAGDAEEKEVPVDDRRDGGIPFATEPPEPDERKRRGRGRA